MKQLALLLAALPLAAQLQVFMLQGNTPTPASASINLGTVAVRDAAEFRFRALNAGTAPIPLQTVAVSGTAFSLTTPFAPVTLAPSQTYDFSVRFNPAADGSFSATLTVNSFSAFLRATAVPAPSLYLDTGAELTELTSPSMQVNVAIGTTLTIPFVLANPYPTPLTLAEVSVTGPGFSLTAPPPSGGITMPSGQRIAIPVLVTSAAGEGEAVGVLIAGQRRFTIVASIFRQPLTPPRILAGNASPQNGQQLRVRLQLSQPALTPGTGTLRATFSGAQTDPAIVFPNGSREIKFDVAPGSSEATFNGAPETVIQTGTTAGTLRLEAITDSGTTTETYRFEPRPVVIDETAARRNGSNLEIDLTGFDNTRGVGSLNFRFFDRSGNALGGVITTTPADQFKTYFDQSTIGGVFRLRASFPVTGDATLIGSVLVEVANAVGRTDVPRINFP